MKANRLLLRRYDSSSPVPERKNALGYVYVQIFQMSKILHSYVAYLGHSMNYRTKLAFQNNESGRKLESDLPHNVEARPRGFRRHVSQACLHFLCGADISTTTVATIS